MATNDEVQAAEDSRDEMVIRDGVRYRPKDAAKLDAQPAGDDAQTTDTADAEKKTRSTSANKARTAGDGDK
jgi:precorrin isomerase